MKNRNTQGRRQLMQAAIIGAIGVAIPMSANAGTEIDSASNASQLIDEARLVGSAEHPVLIVPIEIPEWAANIGITGVQREYKGICGPNGAHISGSDLYRTAQADLERIGRQQRGTSTEVVGESPAFAITYDTTDPLFSVLYLPVIRSAVEYLDSNFDNRVEIGATLALGTFTGNVIGSASSTRYTIPWSVYVEGLRQQSTRDDARFSAELPESSIGVNYNGSSSTTAEAQILVTDAQLRAVFGQNVVPDGQGVSITFNSDIAWNFVGCAVDPGSNQQSLIDVAVHEFVHAMGFTSGIANGGNNSIDQIQGLDVARFRAVQFPGTNAQFTNNSRVGEGFTGELHFYSSFPTGGSTVLESGDGHQPSHLNFTSDTEDKLGVMDPVINRGTTRCPNFLSEDDVLPLDDMGWRPIAELGLRDCNGNGVFDLFDILAGTSQDVDNDKIPDECETFYTGAGDPLTANGITRTIFETPGLTDLTMFNPTGPGTTVITSGVIPEMNDPMSFPNANTRVIQYEFSMFVPSRDEYAFRLAHTDNMVILVDNFVIGQSTRSGKISRTNSSTELSSQSFIHLEAGWHNVFIQLLSQESTPFAHLVRESRSLGGWQDIPTNNMKTLNFTDCDGNGENDYIDRMDDLGLLFDVGSIGESNTDLRFDTCGSNFDTEIALWDSSGTLLAQNDDDCGRQSVLNENLPAGDYVLAITGYNVSFGSDYAVNPIGDCSNSGDWKFNVENNEILSGSIPSGRVMYISFSLGDADCDGDGTPDSAELDCDNNGVPDDCEIPTQADADAEGSLGVIGVENELITISTCGSNFDTEIAVFDSAGNLIDENDDFCGPAPARQSQLDLQLAAGRYYVAVSGYNTVFSDGFGIEINAGGTCSVGGELDIMVGDFSATDFLFGSGRVVLAPFDVDIAPVCQADLTGDGSLNFFDVSSFLSLFSASDPIADFNNDGAYNFFDVSAFLTAFANGCP